MPKIRSARWSPLLTSAILSTLATIATLCVSATSSRAQTVDLVVAPVDPAIRVVLRGEHPAWALPQNSQGKVPDDTSFGHMTLILKRSAPRQQAFEQFLKQVQDPASPNYRRWLTSVEIGKRFGASPDDIDAVSTWLRDQGLHVDSVSNSGVLIDFSGTASVVGAAFSTEMCYYLVAGEQRIATRDEPQIPSALQGIVQSIKGLYTIKELPQVGVERAHIPLRGTGLTLPQGDLCNMGGCGNYIFPSDFATIYDLNPVYNQGLDGTGQTIALLGRSRAYIPDIESFETVSGLVVKDPTVIVPPLGTDPGPPAGPGGSPSDYQKEATLDVMRSTSVAPGATINLIVSFTNGNSFGDLSIDAEYVVDSDPVIAQIMSISFLSCESEAGLSNVQFWDALFSQAAAEGMSVFVASGDAGAAGCDSKNETPPEVQSLSTNSICSSSYATCVGGTEFADAADPSAFWEETPSDAPPYESALGYIPEGGWNEPLNGSQTRALASGGGFSVYIPTPSWQTGTGVPGTQGRYTPDIAFSSSIHDGYFGCLAAEGHNCVVQNGFLEFGSFYGTSAAAPDMAGITALLNQKFQSPQGQLNQRLYQLAADPTNAVFHDVTVGSSGVIGCVLTVPSMCNNSTPSPTELTGGLAGYLVTPGFDEVTGLGSIDVGNLLANWPSATFAISATPASQTISSGDTATFTITVTPKGNYTSPITFTATLDPSSTAEVKFSPATITLNGSSAATSLTIVAATSAASGTLHTSNNFAPLFVNYPNVGILETSFFLIPIGITGLFLFNRRHKRHRTVTWQFLATAVVSFFAVALFGCTHHHSQTYSVQITATAPALGNSAAVKTSTVVMLTARE
jgi:pseudomonalisin